MLHDGFKCCKSCCLITGAVGDLVFSKSRLRLLGRCLGALQCFRDPFGCLLEVSDQCVSISQHAPVFTCQRASEFVGLTCQHADRQIWVLARCFKAKSGIGLKTGGLQKSVGRLMSLKHCIAENLFRRSIVL